MNVVSGASSVPRRLGGGGLARAARAMEPAGYMPKVICVTFIRGTYEPCCTYLPGCQL
jgi:hypothetical protein